MNKTTSDKRSDILTTHRPTNISAMEPLLISENAIQKNNLMDLVIELATKSAKFKASLPSAIQDSLKTVVRSMNCYYSNLIEGHNTHPIDIERALKGHYSSDLKKRNLQKEAKAHIEVQKLIDNGKYNDSFFASSTLCDIHREFYKLLPKELLIAEDPDRKEKIKIIPGKLRHREVKVGNHIPISPGDIPQFLHRFESIYGSLNKAQLILALAASHHRLLWIHPFLDGNGRVARLMTHAAMFNVLDTGGLWSISRGLARNSAQYKMHLANCDLTRRNDLDGRGNLSEEALIDFTKFFFEVCLDQIDFMETLMQPDLLRTRILMWAKEEIEMKKLPAQSLQILEAILYRGEISRGEISSILNLTDRHARRLTGSLIDKGILTSDTPKSALKLAFPAALASRWMPGLFPT